MFICFFLLHDKSSQNPKTVFRLGQRTLFRFLTVGPQSPPPNCHRHASQGTVLPPPKLHPTACMQRATCTTSTCNCNTGPRHYRGGGSGTTVFATRSTIGQKRKTATGVTVCHGRWQRRDYEEVRRVIW